MYIGQSNRKNKTCIDEHIASYAHAIKLGTVKTSGNNDSSLPEHCLQEGHTFQFDNFKILHEENIKEKGKC